MPSAYIYTLEVSEYMEICIGAMMRENVCKLGGVWLCAIYYLALYDGDVLRRHGLFAPLLAKSSPLPLTIPTLMCMTPKPFSRFRPHVAITCTAYTHTHVHKTRTTR